MVRRAFFDSISAIVFFLLLAALFGATGVRSTDTSEQLLLSETKKSVVMLAVYEGEGIGGGTGFIMRGLKTGKKYVVTNAHICDIAAHENMFVADDFKKPGAVALIVDNELRAKYKVDMCIMETKYDAPALEVADALTMDEKVYVVGHGSLLPKTLVAGFIGPDEEDTLFYQTATGEVKRTDYIKFTYGAIDKAESNGYSPFMIHMTFISANVVGGNSGSPVVNAAGKVVGIVFGKAGNGQSGYMVPFKEFKDIIEKL